MRRSLWLAGLCCAAFALSLLYLQYYLRGGPRIIDATSYFLEARSLAAGSFSFHVPDPSAAFRGRFLLASADGHELGVIFPPGYPLVLSLGVRAGAPLLVGPLLGALLVLATYRLARALGEQPKVAMLAAMLSVLCGALRYHTADTMSHGLAALLLCSALALTLEARSSAATLVAGGCLGLLSATRPVSAGVALLLVGYAVRRKPRRSWLLLALGTLPGVALLLLQQRALTGHWLGSTQLAYYAVSDAPAGCFRYGFGAGTGCHFEHGDYVSRYLPNGYGFVPALRNLAVHLRVFASDATNFAPLTLLGGVALFKHRHSPLALAGYAVLLQALAYLPFYFDGNYPGGGARFLAEVIPLAQIAVARAAWDLRLGWLAPAISALGFAVFAHHGHEELRDREGGRPMFEPAVLERAGVEHGLVLVSTDHGFNLGHRPGATDARLGIVVARARDDAHDRELYERLGAPPTYRYEFDLKGRSAPRLVAYEPAPNRRQEGEADWPALMVQGSAYPTHYPCASGGRGLRLLPGSTVELPLSPSLAGEGSLTMGWLAKTGEGARLRLRWGRSTRAEQLLLPGPGCSAVLLPGHPPSVPSSLFIELISGEGALDYLAPGAPVTR
ncbi:MAG TPA: hypothetical protein VHB79_22715 [Polyangiaceae bacterium]|nr:hypothetical protein [Polyangiaceae bacterium]